MATIYSNRNDNTGTHTTVNPNTGTTWVGGVVPTAADQVYIVGRRTTINFSSGYSKWVGATTITVASTSNFAATGFFYTQTTQGDLLKVNYTGLTSTTFTGCTLDESDSMYKWNREGATTNGTIFNGAYVHNPAYIITINTGETFECNELILQEGGWILVNGGTLKVNQGIIVRDGRLVGRGSGQIIISRNSQGLSGSYIGYLNSENYYMSVIDIDGGENRTYATVAQNVSKGSGVITVTGVTNGSFAVGDEIAVYLEGDSKRRNVGYNGYRDATASFKDMDEGFDVVGVNGNDIYIGLRNGARGLIKSVSTAGSQKVVEVKPEHVYFMAGDKVVINNAVYTVDSIEDSEYTLYDYDFTNPATSLSDFWVNATDHVYSGNWQIFSGIGIGTNTTGYRELTHKYFWDRECVVEAWMSPLDGYISGVRATGKYGIQATYDPSFRWGHRSDDSAKADYFQVNEGSDWLGFWMRSMVNYGNNRLSRNTPLRDELRVPAKFKIDTRKARTTTSINDNEFSTDFRRDGNWKGTVGLVCANDRMRCSRLVIKVPTQKLYITTANNITAGQMLYRTGSEIPHPIGRKVVKIASINTGTGSHQDLAFAYRGQSGNGEWPMIIQLNGVNTTHSSFPYLHNHDFNVDYYYDLTNATTAKSITIDLTSQKTFTHVSFVPRINDYSEFYGFNGVAIYGSNDLTNWTTLYGPTNDTKNWYYGTYNRIGYYPTGTVSYRYVKFETKGAQVSPYTNRYVNIGVHNFSEGYTIDLNNASDLAIGDKITVSSDAGYSWGSRDYEGYKAHITGVDPETYYHGGWLMECTIINKVGNKIYLNRPIFWGYVENHDSVAVIKSNRNFVITGTMMGTTSTNDWRWPNIDFANGGNQTRKYAIKNTRLQYIGSWRYASSTSHNRGIIIRQDDSWNHTEFDGNVHMMGPDGNTWSGIGTEYGYLIMRNCLVIGMYTGMYSYYGSSYTGNAVFNNKFLGTYYGIYAELGSRNFAINYNEISTSERGITVASSRVDRNVFPYFNEIKRNFVKGTSNAGFYVYSETLGPRRIPRIKIEDNKIRATDDYSINSSMFSGSPFVGTNAMGEHTGSRLSRYRNEGHISNGDTSSDLSYQNMQENFGRYGYDLTHAAWNIAERNPSRPDITRFYTINGDQFLANIGLELEVLEDNIPVQIYVKFDYRFPTIARMQDDGTDDGRIRCYSVQNGTQIELKYGEIPSSMTNGWHTFEGTFSGFSQTEGKISVYVNKLGGNGYVEFKNGTAHVLSDSPNKLRVIGNTFNLSKVWDQYGEIRDIKPLSIGGTRTTKINRVKF